MTMWYIVLIVCIGYVIIKFMLDRADLNDNISQRGGMRKVYSQLFEYFLCDDECEIISEKNDEIIILLRTDTSINRFRFLQLFGKLRIECIIKSSIVGEIKCNWEFPNNTDQELMINTITRDIDNKFKLNLFSNF